MTVKGEGFKAEGDVAESMITGVVHGEISSPEAEATQKEMQRREHVMKTLDDLAEKHGNQDDIARAFEDASGLSNPTERVETTLESLQELLDTTEKGVFKIFHGSKRDRLNAIIMQLQELKTSFPSQKLELSQPEASQDGNEREDFSDFDDEPTQA